MQKEYEIKHLEEKIIKFLKIFPSDLKSWNIVKRSLDARKTPLMYNYQLGVFADGEEKIVKNA